MTSEQDSRLDGARPSEERAPSDQEFSVSTGIISRVLGRPEDAMETSDLPAPRLSRRVLITLGKDLAEAERVLVHQKEFLESIVDNISDGLFVLTVDLKIVKINPALIHLLGCEESDLLGEPLDILFEAGERPLEPFDSDSLPVPDRWKIPHINVISKDRQRIPVSFQASVIRRRDGRLLGISGTVRDIRNDLRGERMIRAAERKAREAAAQEHSRAEELEKANRSLEDTTRDLKRTQEQLVQSEKLSAVGSLVAGVAHELNNPLTSVLGFSQLLLMGDCEEKIRKDLKKIHREATRCQKIVQNLLRFSRQTKPRWERVDIHQAIEQILELRAYELRNGNIKVVKELDPDLRPVRGDTQQIQQVFLNIINNSLDSMAERDGKGTLTIRTETIDEAARITITDTGVGLSEELRHRVFDPFFTTKEVGKGTGLGLSVSHGIVTGHGGDIEILPTEVGAAFQVSLPIHDGMEAPSRTPSQIDPSPGGSWRILVVDDEETVLDVIGRLLRSEGHRVSTAATVADALALLEQSGGAFDVVLSDYRMPNMDGAEFHQILEGRYPDLVRRLIFVTGDGANKLTHDFLQKKDCLYINKPFRLEEFRRALHRSVRSKSRRPVPSREVWLLDADPSVAEILTTAIYDVTGSSAPLRTLRTPELLLEDLKKFIPRMLLLDLGITEPPGLDLVRMIKRMHPEVRVVALSHHARRREAEKALAAGVEEYLLKPVRGREAALILEKILS